MLVVPVAVRLTADLLLRSSRHVTVMIAARRLQAQPASVTRVVSGLLIGLFVVIAGRSLVVAFESTSQYAAAKQSLSSGQQATVHSDNDNDNVEATLARVQKLPGVSGTVAIPHLQSAACPENPDGTYVPDSSCGQQAVITNSSYDYTDYDFTNGLRMLVWVACSRSDWGSWPGRRISPSTTATARCR